MRKGIMTLVESLGRHLRSGALEELTLTTNGSQLAKYAAELAAHGVRRINVSVDTLDDAKFKQITRWGDLAKVKEGIRAAQAAGLAIKINAVALKGVNEQEIPEMIRWCARRGHGPDADRNHAAGRHRRRPHRPVPAAVGGAGPADGPVHAGGHSLQDRRPGALCEGRRKPAAGSASSRRSPIISAKAATGCGSPAPARSTCAWARRMPPTCAAPLRASEGNDLLNAAIDEAIGRKPKGHDFIIDRRHNKPAVSRHMSVTGG